MRFNNIIYYSNIFLTGEDMNIKKENLKTIVEDDMFEIHILSKVFKVIYLKNS
jgi:hypothetical protein